MSVREELRQLPAAPRDLRKFSWLVGGVLVGIGAFLTYRGSAAGGWVLGIGATLVIVGSLAPPLVRPLYYAWMALALVLGMVMTRVLLTIFFFLVLTPVGLFFKLIRRDALRRKLDRSATTYWLDKETLIPDRSRYEKFF